MQQLKADPSDDLITDANRVAPPSAEAANRVACERADGRADGRANGRANGPKNGPGDALASGTQPLVILMNARSGAQESDAAQETIATRLQQAQRRFRIVAVEHGEELAARAQVEAQAARADGAALVAAGGDGTLNAVARAALAADVPFGALPQGTFNYFARCHGIALELDAALTQLLSARIQPIQVGRVRDAQGSHPFLVNASVGLYPRLLEDREAVKARLGRSRFNALLAALTTLMRGAPRWRLVLQADGAPARAVRLTTLFVGNNQMQLEKLGLPQASVVEEGQLAALLVRAPTRRAMLATALRGALGRVTTSDAVDSTVFERMEVRPQDPAVRWLKVAVDGEVLQLQPPLTFDLQPQRLQLLAPAAPVVAAARAD